MLTSQANLRFDDTVMDLLRDVTVTYGFNLTRRLCRRFALRRSFESTSGFFHVVDDPHLCCHVLYEWSSSLSIGIQGRLCVMSSCCEPLRCRDCDFVLEYGRVDQAFDVTWSG